MRHDCKEVMPNSIVIVFNEYSKVWMVKSMFDVYQDENADNHLAMINTIMNIKYCPYCGERLVSE